jgi:hypothetical protein
MQAEETISPLEYFATNDAHFPGLGVEAFGVRERRKLYEIPVAHRVSREQHEVVVGLAAVAGTGALAPVAGGDVCLHADDGLDSCFLRLLLKVPGAVKISVIGYREGGLFELLRAADQIANAIGTVEQRVFGMAVEMDE